MPTSVNGTQVGERYLRRVLEGVGAAVWCIHALEREVSTPLAWCLAIALDLTAFALIAVYNTRQPKRANFSPIGMGSHGLEVLTRQWKCIDFSWSGCVLVQRCLRRHRLSSSHHDHLAGVSCLRQYSRSCCLIDNPGITPALSWWNDIGG